MRRVKRALRLALRPEEHCDKQSLRGGSTHEKSTKMGERFRTFDRFWPYYAGEHKDPLTRRMHFIGTSAGLLCLVGASISGEILLVVLAPLLSYGWAWAGHLFVERNTPVTLRQPLFSLMAALKMYCLMWSHAMNDEAARCASMNLQQGRIETSATHRNSSMSTNTDECGRSVIR